MASIDWQKQTRQKAGAMRRHLGKREREEVNHSNPDIDRSKSHLNYYIGCDDYEEAYQRMCDRVQEVDKKYPPKRTRKDRAVCVSLEFPCPSVLTEQGRSREFFEASHELFKEFFGVENVNGMCVHLDEVHKYIDPKDGLEKMSLEHATELVTACTEWVEKDKVTGAKVKRKGVNGKNFETRARLNALNKAMCEMVKEKFGVDYNTGEGARKKTAEILKAESELAALEIEKQKSENELIKLRERNNDFVRALTPTPTKKVKGIFGEKEAEKKPEELQRDREVLAAQSILRREQELAAREEESKARKVALNNLEAELVEKTEQHNERVRRQDHEVAVKAERLCKEQLARSERYQAFREHQSIAARWRSKLEGIIKLAQERSKYYVNSLISRYKNHRSTAIEKTVYRSK